MDIVINKSTYNLINARINIMDNLFKNHKLLREGNYDSISLVNQINILLNDGYKFSLIEPNTNKRLSFNKIHKIEKELLPSLLTIKHNYTIINSLLTTVKKYYFLNIIDIINNIWSVLHNENMMVLLSIYKTNILNDKYDEYSYDYIKIIVMKTYELFMKCSDIYSIKQTMDNYTILYTKLSTFPSNLNCLINVFEDNKTNEYIERGVSIYNNHIISKLTVFQLYIMNKNISPDLKKYNFIDMFNYFEVIYNKKKYANINQLYCIVINKHSKICTNKNDCSYYFHNNNFEKLYGMYMQYCNTK